MNFILLCMAYAVLGTAICCFVGLLVVYLALVAEAVGHVLEDWRGK